MVSVTFGEISLKNNELCVGNIFRRDGNCEPRQEATIFIHLADDTEEEKAQVILRVNLWCCRAMGF